MVFSLAKPICQRTERCINGPRSEALHQSVGFNKAGWPIICASFWAAFRSSNFFAPGLGILYHSFASSSTAVCSMTKENILFPRKKKRKTFSLSLKKKRYFFHAPLAVTLANPPPFLQPKASTVHLKFLTTSADRAVSSHAFP